MRKRRERELRADSQFVEWLGRNLLRIAAAPEGFQGEADEWFADQRFGLWTLHAWAWKVNPASVFRPTNTLVP